MLSILSFLIRGGHKARTTGICFALLFVASLPLSGLYAQSSEGTTNTYNLDSLNQEEVTPPLVKDRYTGLAIYGYDPIAYFTDNEAAKGLGIFEFKWQGGYWWFTTINNRDIFSADPDIYAPRFGGYDPVELAKGKLVASEPDNFTLVNKTLFLFARKSNQKAFEADPDGYLAKAAEVWNDVDRLRR